MRRGIDFIPSDQSGNEPDEPGQERGSYEFSNEELVSMGVPMRALPEQPSPYYSPHVNHETEQSRPYDLPGSNTERHSSKRNLWIGMSAVAGVVLVGGSVAFGTLTGRHDTAHAIDHGSIGGNQPAATATYDPTQGYGDNYDTMTDDAKNAAVYQYAKSKLNGKDLVTFEAIAQAPGTLGREAIENTYTLPAMLTYSQTLLDSKKDEIIPAYQAARQKAGLSSIDQYTADTLTRGIAPTDSAQVVLDSMGLRQFASTFEGFSRDDQLKLAMTLSDSDAYIEPLDDDITNNKEVPFEASSDDPARAPVASKVFANPQALETQQTFMWFPDKEVTPARPIRILQYTSLLGSATDPTRRTQDIVRFTPFAMPDGRAITVALETDESHNHRNPGTAQSSTNPDLEALRFVANLGELQ